MNTLRQNQNTMTTVEYIYEIFLTLVLSFAILWVIYQSVGYCDYRLYMTDTK